MRSTERCRTDTPSIFQATDALDPKKIKIHKVSELAGHGNGARKPARQSSYANDRSLAMKNRLF
jgi:hypothetical protein